MSNVIQIRFLILMLAFLSLAVSPNIWFASVSAQAETVLVFDPAKNKWVRKEGKKPRPGFGGKAPVEREIVAYQSDYKPGTIIIDTKERRLYRVEDAGSATRYGIGVGREGFSWKGSERITRKAEWPSWTPPAEMRKREAAKGRILPVRMDGGIENPLGARALYLGNTLYRIHGTNQPWTIGQAVSSGCIRMTNEDVVHLYNNARVGDLVVVR
ncbi:L,D-transpeptidase [Roseibium sp. MMSF_3544]|uniref:L,D-transpeptidase n=1 Tax=unclassified Roseibium TaxID=2629323 RepID=UPI00273D1902|nr:L,D-transpeptidase [Roseibium sp. MMSF_3544]